MSITESQLHILRHSLGLTRGSEMYRNHFCTGEGSKDFGDCQRLVELGHMTRQGPVEMYGGDYVFHVTDAGKAVATQARADA